jgi:hypothetical protein
MKFAELVDRLKTSGRDVSSLVAWRVDPAPPPPAAYNIVRSDDGDYAVGMPRDRGNGYFFATHTKPDGSTTASFATPDDACDWIWARLNDPALVPQLQPVRTPTEIEEQQERIEDRHRQAELKHMREHPELWADYFRAHPDQRPSDL